eukprot:gene2653-2897_t
MAVAWMKWKGSKMRTAPFPSAILLLTRLFFVQSYYPSGGLKTAVRLISPVTQTAFGRKLHTFDSQSRLPSSQLAAPENNVREPIEFISDEDDLVGDDEEDLECSEDEARKSLRLKKVRQHVNPLSNSYLQPLTLADNWLDASFQTPRQPLIIDVGCAKGSWALNVARLHPHLNVLGLEIRRPVVELCIQRKAYWKVPNVHFLSSNANVHLLSILDSLSAQQAEVRMITIQFADPHFKKRHQKRRVVNPEFVDILASKLSPQCQVFVQTDVQELAQDQVSHFLARSEAFQPMPGYDIERLEENPSPFTVKTEREIATLAKQLPVYRMLFQRTSSPATLSNLGQ